MTSFLVISVFLLHVTFTQSTQEWKVDISSSTEKHFEFWWNKCVGSSHAALALRKDWRQQIKYVHDETGISSVRFHGILDDDVGVVNAINDYSFINIDKIYDYLLSINMRPYVEISFMPYAFASYDCFKQHVKANVTPPKNYTVWNDFIKQWMTHLVNRYGINEVSQWKFEIWNEANDKFFQQTSQCNESTLNDYLKLYSNTAYAIKSVSSELKVGGPATNNPNTWMIDFLNATITQQIPIDFISTHAYPSSTKNDLKWWYNELNEANTHINTFQQYKNMKVYLSEFNSGLWQHKYNFDNHDSVYTSAFLIFMMHQLQPLLAINNNSNHFGWLSYWAFTDIFEEQGFHSAPFWLNDTLNTQSTNTDYGMITIRGINKPVFNAMKLIYKYGSNISYNVALLNSSNQNEQTVIVYCLKNKLNKNRYSILISNFANYGSNIQNETLIINVTQTIDSTVSQPISAFIYRIDEDNCNPLATWINMGKPIYPTVQQLKTLNESTQLIASKIQWKQLNTQTIQFQLVIPVYGVALIDLQY
eukprot:332099_1